MPDFMSRAEVLAIFGGTWQPAKPSDTPGQVEPDDARPQPIVAGTVDDYLHALYLAWAVIANVSEGHWDEQTADWQHAATTWRDEQFHRLLDMNTDNS